MCRGCDRVDVFNDVVILASKRVVKVESVVVEFQSCGACEGISA